MHSPTQHISIFPHSIFPFFGYVFVFFREWLDGEKSCIPDKQPSGTGTCYCRYYWRYCNFCSCFLSGGVDLEESLTFLGGVKKPPLFLKREREREGKESTFENEVLEISFTKSVEEEGKFLFVLPHGI
jgi:hypothetical protein